MQRTKEDSGELRLKEMADRISHMEQTITGFSAKKQNAERNI